MKLAKNLTISFFLVLLSSLAFTSSAEQMKKLGDWEVHYIAFGSTFISPEIAKIYQIERSRYKGLINISVLDASQEGKPAVAVGITGKARNLLGSTKDIEFREIKEGNAIYYIAQINYTHEEQYRFTIDLVKGNEKQTLTFQQKFYAE